MGAAPAVELVGVPQTRRLLREFEPDLLKRLDRRLGELTAELRAAAQARFAMTGAGGTAYRVRTRNRIDGFSAGVATVPGSVARGQRWSSSPGVLAAIFEFADGVRDARPQNVERTRSLIVTLNALYGRPGRFLWQAYDDEGGNLAEKAAAEIKAVEAEYTERLRA